MNKYIFILLLLSISFSAFAQNSTNKIKAVLHDDTLSIKALLKSPMIGEEENKGGGVWGTTIKPISYITKITAISNNKEIFNIDTNPFLSTNPIFKFKIKNALVIDKAKLIIRYDSGNTKTEMFNIINAQTINKHEKRSFSKKFNNSLFWNAKTVDKAIKILYGTKEMIDNKIDVTTPKLSSNSGSIPVLISTDIDLESIAILMSANPRSAVAIVSTPSGKLIQFAIRVKAIYPIQVSKNDNGEYDVNTETYITVIGKARNGKLYKTTKYVKLGICVNSGGGLEDFQIENLYKIQHQH